MTGPYRPRAVVCVVNGHTFYVRRIEECGGYRIPDYRPDIGKHTGKRGGYRVAKKWRRLVPPPPPTPSFLFPPRLSWGVIFFRHFRQASYPPVLR